MGHEVKEPQRRKTCGKENMIWSRRYFKSDVLKTMIYPADNYVPS